MFASNGWPPRETLLELLRTLADGTHGDVPIVAGESGVAGLAALQDLAGSDEGRRAAGLGPDARVLLINSEGATALGVYARIVGRGADAVQAAQRAWLQRRGLSGDRLSARLAEHATIGAIDGGGVCRVALTDADKAVEQAVRAAIMAESTRLIWPAPMPTVARSLA